MAPIKRKQLIDYDAEDDCMVIPLNQEGLQRDDELLHNQGEDESIHQEEEEEELKESTSKEEGAMKNLKRKAQMKKTMVKKQKKHMTTKELLEEQSVRNGMYTMLMVVMLLWDDESTANVFVPNLKTMIRTLIKEKRFPLKKSIYLMLSIASNIIEEMKRVTTGFSTFSIEDFVNVLLKSESYTTFTNYCLTEEDVNWIVDNYDPNLKVESSSSSATMTTSTSCTIAPTQTEAAGVPSSSISGGSTKKSAGDILDELFQAGSSATSIGAISQSIVKREGDTLYTWSSPGESGYQVVKLDVYDYSRICSVPKELWWKQAMYRSTFLISSVADPKAILVQKLLAAAAQQIQGTSGSKQEVKATRSSSFYKSDQQRH